MNIPIGQLVAHIVITLLFPPLMLGVVNKTKAWFGGRVGPPVLQLYFDLFKLLQKDSVFSTTTTWIFRFGPVVGWVTVALASLLLPLAGTDAPIHFPGDMILFAYLLALARFFTILAALDTGSAFEGMGTAREATYACLAEPIVLFGLLVLAKISGGSLELAGVLRHSAPETWGLSGAAMMLIVMSWFLVLLVENCRIPFDDPNTHLELTMIHEVMVLDHSGPPFGLILYSASIKFFLFATLLVRLVVPLSFSNALLNWSLFLVALLLVAVAVGVVESVMARFRLIVIPRMLIVACVVSAFGLVLLVSKSS